MTERPYPSPEPEPVGRIPPYLRMAPAGGSAAGAPGHDRDDAEEAGSPAARSTTPRPFVLTSGRVDAGEIGLETQVTLRPEAGPAVLLTPEQQAIVGLCGRPISVVELSALLHLHLGVTKILVADMRAAGYLDVHVADTLDAQSPETILRVMRGLRAIS